MRAQVAATMNECGMSGWELCDKDEAWANEQIAKQTSVCVWCVVFFCWFILQIAWFVRVQGRMNEWEMMEETKWAGNGG